MLFIVLIFSLRITGCPCTVGFPVLSHYNSFRHTVLIFVIGTSVHFWTGENHQFQFTKLLFIIWGCTVLFQTDAIYLCRFLHVSAGTTCLSEEIVFFLYTAPAACAETENKMHQNTTINNKKYNLFSFSYESSIHFWYSSSCFLLSFQCNYNYFIL